MLRSFLVASLICAAPAAASGFSVELGPGFAGATFAGELAINGVISLAPGSAIELRTRGYFTVPELTRTQQLFVGGTLSVRNRTAPLGFFTLAFGGGLVVWRDCLWGDFCGGFGPHLDLSPTFSFQVSETVRLFAAVNASGGPIFGGNPGIWLAGGLTLGASFDFGPRRLEKGAEP